MSYYYEEIAVKIPRGLAKEADVWNAAYDIIKAEEGNRRAFHMMNYDPDFASDVISTYFWCEKNGRSAIVD